MSHHFSSEELVKEIVKVLDNKKAIDITAIKIKDLSTIGDYFVVASGSNLSQVRALAEAVDEKLSSLGVEPKRIEGYQSCLWVLMDYYDVVVHIFNHETREFYSLERLWADAPKLDISGLVTKE
ncbi:MAG: ribosome silencing factor [Angelakisella sp.]|nr:ribosome silencing factor [Angelakisella sp.]